jgi:hypothetical protein
MERDSLLAEHIHAIARSRAGEQVTPKGDIAVDELKDAKPEKDGG